MKRNWKSRVFAGLLCFVLMFGLLPTGILSELMPELVPDTAVNADAISTARINGLFIIRDPGTGNVLTADPGNGWNVAVKFKPYDGSRHQHWIIESTGTANAHIRPVSAVWAYSNDRSGHGDMWLRRFGSAAPYQSLVYSFTQANDGTHSPDSGNPSGDEFTWRFTQGGGGAGISIISGDTFGAYLSNPDGWFYLYNNGGTASQSAAGSATYLHFEPAYDPDMNYNGPLVIVNQPGGNTSYHVNDTGSAITMVQHSSAASAPVQQTWALVKATKGYFFIVNRSTGKYLGADANGAVNSAVSTGESYQWQVFRQRDDGSAATFKIINKYTGYTLHYNGTTLSAKNLDTANRMHTYMSLSYNRLHASDNLWSTYYISTFNSNSSIYWPATFDDKSYISIKLNYIKDCNERTGYLFHTAATNSPTGIDSKSTSTVSGNAAGYVQNTAVQGFDYTAPSYSPDVGNVRVKFTFTKNSTQNTSPFLIIEGHYNQGTTSVTIKNSGGTTVASGSQAGYGRKEISIGNLANGTYTLELSGGEHYGIFTNILPDSASGKPSMALTDTNTVNGKVVHGDVSYALKITNPRNQAISKVNFSVTVKEGSTTVATLTYNNGTVTGNNTYATLSGGASQIAGNNGSATWTITLLYSGMGSGKSYSVSVASDGSCYAYSGNAAPSNPGIARATNTLTVTKCNGNHINGSVTFTPSGFVNGTVTYTITLTNYANHEFKNICFTFGNSDVTLFKVTNGAIASGTQHASVTSVTGLANTVAAASGSTQGKLVITVNVDSTKLPTAGGSYTFNITGSSAVTGTNTTGTHNDDFNASGSGTITTVSGNVTFTVSSNVAGDSTVKGDVIYSITIENGTNHKVNNINFILKAGSVELLEVTNGVFTFDNALVEVSISSITELTAGQELKFTVTVHTTKLDQGKSFSITTTEFSCYGSNLASGQSRKLTVAAKTVQSITTANGSVIVGLTSSTVNNNGVGEGDVSYKITFENKTNHALKGLTFTVYDSEDNKLLTVNNDGSITVHDSTLVKNSSVSVNGSLTSLASGGKVEITGIIIDAKASKLDATGRLILTATGNSDAKDVLGSLGDSLTYADTSDSFTIMVRHDVNLLVQSGISTTITAEQIFAAMNKSGAYATEKGLGLTNSSITAIAITDINGGSKTVSGLSVSGTKNLKVNLTAEYTEFIIKVTYNGKTVLVPIQVTTVSSGEDKTFVLDYGLPVSIDKATMLDDVRLTGGAYSTAANAVKGFSAAMNGAGATTLTGTFGNFAYANNAFGYTPAKFMDNEDATYVVVLVGNENGTENVDYVNVYKRVAFIPSNVIYYEDTMTGSITYPTGFDLTELGELAAIGVALEQDMPVTGNMGFDDGSYANATDVMLSGESVQKITVEAESVSVHFTVVGTGFELISRVNAKDAATLLVHVIDPSGNEKTYPVITRFDPDTTDDNFGAEVYQVPVFRLNNGTYGTYEVEVEGLPLQDFDENGDVTSTETSYIYIDGIRIYNPLGDSNLTDHYGVEQDAQFDNLRDMILAGQGTLAAYTDTLTGFVTGDHYYVQSTDEWYSAALGGINDLGCIGANNEILVRKDDGNFIVVLKVKENTTGEGLLQIGIHDVHDAKFDGNNGANATTSVSYHTASGWEPLVVNTLSGTEQYYNIDLSQCYLDGEYRVVVLRVDSGFASFTNIKHKNVTFGEIGEKALDIFIQNGFYFNEDGQMCTKDENGNEIVSNDSALFNLNMINDIMEQDNAENK